MPHPAQQKHEPATLPLIPRDLQAALHDRFSRTKCARTACSATRNVVCRHTHSGALYCPRCARKINEHNPGLVTMPGANEREEVQAGAAQREQVQR